LLDLQKASYLFMKLYEAMRFRDEYREKLIGKPFTQKDPSWQIKDVIVSNKKYVGAIYTKMYKEKISNEFAIKFFSIKENDFYVYVVSEQWPGGNGEVHSASIDSYMKLVH
jgi:hypothetical protein